MKTFLILTLTSFMVLSCSKDKKNAPIISPQLGNDDAFTSGGGTNGQWGNSSSKKSYQTVINGCDTGYHEFNSSSSQETMRQYCAALQDDALNNHCARQWRDNTYEEDCRGQNTYADYPVTSSSQFLENLYVENINISEALSSSDRSLARKLARHMETCGFSRSGPNCGDLFKTEIRSRLISLDNGKKFVSNLISASGGSNVVMLFEVDRVDGRYRTNSVKVYRSRRFFIKGKDSVSNFFRRKATFLLEATYNQR